MNLIECPHCGQKVMPKGEGSYDMGGNTIGEEFHYPYHLKGKNECDGSLKPVCPWTAKLPPKKEASNG